MMKPLGKRILVRVLEPPSVTPGGILLPEAAKEEPQEAEVLEVSDEVTAAVEVGDRIIFERFMGTKVDVEDGQEIVILHMDNVWARRI